MDLNTKIERQKARIWGLTAMKHANNSVANNSKIDEAIYNAIINLSKLTDRKNERNT